MYKCHGQIDQKSFIDKLSAIYTMVNGYGEDFLSANWRPQLTPEIAIQKIVRLYSEEYWIDSFNGSKESKEDLRELKDLLATEMVMEVCENLKVKAVKKKEDGGYETKMVKAYDYKKKGDRSSVLKLIEELYFELPCTKLRDEYLSKIDEARFDELTKTVFGTLLKTDDDEMARKFLKLWMIDTKMRRFYHPDEKYPKNPIALSLWGEKQGIGKGFFATVLCESFSHLFNCKKKKISLKDFSARFKGFVSPGIYICHIDEADRVDKGKLDPNSQKTLITEKYINVEHKCVDNDEDALGRIGYISTTNQSISYMFKKDMEPTRRLGEIHVSDACEQFLKGCFDPVELRKLVDELWLTCPVDSDVLAMEVRRILLADSNVMALTDFMERLTKLAEHMGWGELDLSGGFKPYADRKLYKVKWNTDVKQAYDTLFPKIGGWGTFQEFAVNIGFLYKTWKDKKRGLKCYNLDFTKLPKSYEDEDECEVSDVVCEICAASARHEANNATQPQADMIDKMIEDALKTSQKDLHASMEEVSNQ